MFKKLSLSLACIIIAGCVAQPAPEPGKGNGGNNPGNTKSAVERGKELYLSAEQNCATCHGSDGLKVAAGLSPRPIATCHLSDDDNIKSRCGSVTALADYIKRDMPFGDTEKCGDQCSKDLAAYIGQELLGISIEISCDTQKQYASPMRRLNKSELVITVNDIFGAGGEAFNKLETEFGVLQGFATVGSRLDTTFDWTQGYIDAALDAVDQIVDGNAFNHGCAMSDAACLSDEIAKVGKRAFRRDLSSAEKGKIRKIIEDTAKDLDDKDALKSGLLYVLTSPNFLFLNAEADNGGERELSSGEIADRLALALTGAYPDEKLINIANQQNLKGDVLESEIDRLLNSSKFDRFVELFTNGWVGVEDTAKFLDRAATGLSQAELDQLLADMKTETRMFIRHIFANNLPIDEILLANYSFLNKNLGDHYGVNVNGNGFVKTDLPAGSHRRGLLTQGSILASAAQEGLVSYVDRGKLVTSAIACEDMTPPDNVLDAVQAQQNENVTEKQKMVDRADSAICRGCHTKLDPIGWVFTEFGLLGEAVNQDPDGDALDTAGVLWGKPFDDATGLAQVVVDEDVLASCLSTKFLIHAMGRLVKYGDQEDRCAIDAAINNASNNGVIGSRDLLKSLLTSDIATRAGSVVR